MAAMSICTSFFAAELRRARQASGLTQEQLAHAVRYSPSLIASVETGRRAARPDLVARLDECLQTNGLLGRIREELLLRDVTPEWFRQWRDLEAEAISLRSHHPSLIDGLLQTPDYSRAVLRADASLSEEEIEQGVAARGERQARVFGRQHPPVFVAVIDEAALRRPVGGPAVMSGQCRHLLDVARRPRSLLQVIPLSVGMHPGLDGPFIIAGFTDAPDVVHLDGQRGVVVERPEVVSKAKHAWEGLRAEALPRQQSIDLVAEVAQSWNS